MSQSARYVPSPVCLEQIHRQCNCPSTGATAKQHQGLQEKLKTLSSPAAISEVSAQITVLQAQQDKLEIDRQDYQQNLRPVPNYSPLTSTPGISIGFSYPSGCILANVERLGQTYATRCGGNRCLATTDTTPIRDNSCLVAVVQALCSQTQDPDTQHWVLTILLPWVYWHQQTEKTRHTELKQGYHQATQQAHARFLAHSFTHTETLAQQQWIDWAIWMCAKFNALPLLSKDAMAIYLVSIILIGASRNKP